MTQQDLVETIQASLERADRHESRLTPRALALPGMSSAKVRHLLNNVCSRPDVRYLEVGLYRGSTFCSALCGNAISAVGIENWSQFGPDEARRDFETNYAQFVGDSDVRLIYEDVCSVDPSRLPQRINTFFYDGNHCYDSQHQTLLHLAPALDEVFVLLVDDYNLTDVVRGTEDAIAELGYRMLWQRTLESDGNCDTRNWWNGLYVAVLQSASAAAFKEVPAKESGSGASKDAAIAEDEHKLYRRASDLVQGAQYEKARPIYEHLAAAAPESSLRAMARNDMAVLTAATGDANSAREGFEAALAIDADCGPAQTNLAALDRLAGAAAATTFADQSAAPTDDLPHSTDGPCKIAILSFLFNWPSTGGGNIHTVELARFLGKAGYEVKHFYARYDSWDIGHVTEDLPIDSEVLTFDDSTWNISDIQTTYRRAVDAFGPDYVIITDSWNFKPHLAAVVRGYPYLLRQQALECLCPLSNLRLLPSMEQCPYNQLANPDMCQTCVTEHGHVFGPLHRQERTLSEVSGSSYYKILRRAVEEAEAVLVVNPLTEVMFSPYAKCVRVAPSGFDPARFPWPWPDEPEREQPRKLTILVAALASELIKGVHIAREACRRLWRKRRDFELLITSDPPGQVDEFMRFVGWQSQQTLPAHIRAADMLIAPAIAQEALGRTAVEAMGVGRPVVASRIGGLPYTVSDGAGLLCEPGDADDLAAKIALLLDDPQLRHTMGLAGRRRFEEHYTWDVVIERHYRPLLKKRRRQTVARQS